MQVNNWFTNKRRREKDNEVKTQWDSARSMRTNKSIRVSIETNSEVNDENQFYRPTICPICKNFFNETNYRKMTEECGHQFCKSCSNKSDLCQICEDRDSKIDQLLDDDSYSIKAYQAFSQHFFKIQI